jgi:hypothetical protein
MIRKMLTTLLLGGAIFADPAPATADTKPSKSPPKPAPQIVQPPTPSKSSKRHTATRPPYHPHSAGGGGAKQPKRTS